MKKFIAIALLFSAASFAQDTSSKAAIKDVQDTLKNPSKVKEITDNDSKAKSVDTMVKGLAGDDAGEMYAISADILPILMEMNQDNPEKALESLTQYSKNPADFLSSLPPNIRERIQKLSKKIEAKRPTKKP